MLPITVCECQLLPRHLLEYVPSNGPFLLDEYHLLQPCTEPQPRAQECSPTMFVP